MTLQHWLGDTPPPGDGLSLFTPEGPLARSEGLAEHWRQAGGDLRLLCWHRDDSEDIRACAEAAYQALRVELESSGHVHLLRAWTYFDRINEGEGDDERYRQFCIGRAAGLGTVGGHPAATVIGSRRPGFWLYAIAARAPGEPLENPRQTPAWQYPRAYGPQSPGFSRALWRAEEGLLFVSGTSSVVGHETRHPGTPAAQLDETFRNLESLLAEAEARSDAVLYPQSLRLYVRDADEAEALLGRCRAWAPEAHWSVLIGDVCRADLTVEIEGVYARAPDFSQPSD